VKLNQLRDLLAVAEHGSLHAAARHLRIAQPALTRSIRELEREVGAALFERHAQGMIATPMGRRLIRRAEAALAEIRHAQEEIAQLRGEMTGRINMCLTTVPHIALLPKALRAFREKYPGVYIDIVESRFPAVEAGLRAGTLDCYVGPMPQDRPGKEFAVEILFEQIYVVLARKGHPLAGARSLRELKDAEWMTQSVTAKPEDELGPIFKAHRLPPPRLVAQSHTGLTFLTLAASTDLLMLLPSAWAEAELARGHIQQIDIAEKIQCPAIVMITRAATPLTPAAEYFCDMLRRASTPFARKTRARVKIARPRVT